MNTSRTSHKLGLMLTIIVAIYGLFILAIGWGAGLDPVVRIGPEGNAIVPSTALCLILIAAASVPLKSGRIFQRAVLVAGFATLFVIAVADMIGGTEGAHHLGFQGHEGDRMSNATVTALTIALIPAAVRLGMLPLAREWEFHAALFGVLLCTTLTLATVLDPQSFDSIGFFVGLSQYTAILLTLLFAGQLAVAAQHDMLGDADAA